MMNKKCINYKCEDNDQNTESGCAGHGIIWDGHLCKDAKFDKKKIIDLYVDKIQYVVYTKFDFNDGLLRYVSTFESKSTAEDVAKYINFTYEGANAFVSRKIEIIKSLYDKNFGA